MCKEGIAEALLVTEGLLELEGVVAEGIVEGMAEGPPVVEEGLVTEEGAAMAGRNVPSLLAMMATVLMTATREKGLLKSGGQRGRRR